MFVYQRVPNGSGLSTDLAWNCKLLAEVKHSLSAIAVAIANVWPRQVWQCIATSKIEKVSYMNNCKIKMATNSSALLNGFNLQSPIARGSILAKTSGNNQHLNWMSAYWHFLYMIGPKKHAGGLGWCTTFVSANQPNPLSKVYVSGKAPQRGLEQWSWLMTIFHCFSFCFVTPENHRETMLIQIFNPTNYMCCLFSSCQKQGNPIPSWGTRNSQDSSTWSATW